MFSQRKKKLDTLPPTLCSGTAETQPADMWLEMLSCLFLHSFPQFLTCKQGWGGFGGGGGGDKMVAGADEYGTHPSLFIRHEKDTQ